MNKQESTYNLSFREMLAIWTMLTRGERLISMTGNLMDFLRKNQRSGAERLSRFARGEKIYSSQGGYNLVSVLRSLRSHPKANMDNAYAWIETVLEAERHVQLKGLPVAQDSWALKKLFSIYKQKNKAAEDTMVSFQAFLDRKRDPALCKGNYNLSVVVNILRASGMNLQEVLDWILPVFHVEFRKESSLKIAREISERLEKSRPQRAQIRPFSKKEVKVLSLSTSRGPKMEDIFLKPKAA